MYIIYIIIIIMLCVNYVHNVYVYMCNCIIVIPWLDVGGSHTEDLYSLLHLCMCSSNNLINRTSNMIK